MKLLEAEGYITVGVCVYVFILLGLAVLFSTFQNAHYCCGALNGGFRNKMQMFCLTVS